MSIRESVMMAHRAGNNVAAKNSNAISRRTCHLFAAYLMSIALFAFRGGLFIVSWLAAILFALSLFYDRRTKWAPLPTATYLLFGWIIWTGLAVIVNSANVVDGAERLFSVIANVAMLVLIANAVSYMPQRTLNGALLAWVVSAAFTVAVTIVTVRDSWSILFTSRVDAGFYNPNHAAYLFAVSATVACYLAIIARSRTARLLIIPILALLVLGVVMTGSRQGLLVLLIGVAGVSTLLMKPQHTLIVVGALFVVVVTSQVDWDQFVIGRRITRLLAVLGGDHSAETSTVSRLQLITIGLRMVEDYPILGVGFDNFRSYVERYGFVRSTYAHNNYIEVLASGGLLGFFLYYGFVAYVTLGAWRIRKESPLNALMLVLLSSMLISDMFRVSYYQRIETTMLGIALGVVIAQRSRRLSRSGLILEPMRHATVPIGSHSL